MPMTYSAHMQRSASGSHVQCIRCAHPMPSRRCCMRSACETSMLVVLGSVLSVNVSSTDNTSDGVPLSCDSP